MKRTVRVLACFLLLASFMTTTSLADPRGTQLTDCANPEHCGQPSWSPDGSRIAFTRGVDFTRGGFGQGIWCMSTMGCIDDPASCYELFNTPGVNEDHPAWSPDGSTIAYVHDRLRGDNIECADATSGAFLGVLRDDGEIEDSFPAWSPDGWRLAFRSCPRFGGAGSPPCDVWIAELAFPNTCHAAELTKLTSFDIGLLDAPMSWSPDGTEIVVPVYGGEVGDPGSQVLAVDSDTGQPREITTEPGEDRDPDWTVGCGIVFASDRHGDFDVWTVDPDATNPRPLVTAPGTQEVEPELNAEAQLVFESYDDPSRSFADLWKVAVDCDGDGIPDDEDECRGSDLSPSVVIDGCETGVENELLECR